ncbi:unnamed protein product [Arabidopsis halleri]
MPGKFLLARSGRVWKRVVLCCPREVISSICCVKVLLAFSWSSAFFWNLTIISFSSARVAAIAGSA